MCLCSSVGKLGSALQNCRSFDFSFSLGAGVEVILKCSSVGKSDLLLGKIKFSPSLEMQFYVGEVV